MRRTNLILMTIISMGMIFTSCGTQTAPEIDIESTKPLSTSLLDSNIQRLDIGSGSDPVFNDNSEQKEETSVVVEEAAQESQIYNLDVQTTPGFLTETQNDKELNVSEKEGITQTEKITAPVEPNNEIEKKVEALPEVKETVKEITEPTEVFASAEKITETTEVNEPVPVVPSFGWDEYMILPGDYLFRIAKKEYGDWKRWKDIYQWNREKIGDNPNLIYPYHFLDMKRPIEEVKKSVPVFNEYIVQEGDNLWSVAGKTYGDEKSWIIVYWDNEEELEQNDGVIYPGMILKLRVKLDPGS